MRRGANEAETGRLGAAMAMTMRVYEVTAKDVVELVPRHQVAPVSSYTISTVLPPCQCPLHHSAALAPQQRTVAN